MVGVPGPFLFSDLTHVISSYVIWPTSPSVCSLLELSLSSGKNRDSASVHLLFCRGDGMCAMAEP